MEDAFLLSPNIRDLSVARSIPFAVLTDPLALVRARIKETGQGSGGEWRATRFGPGHRPASRLEFSDGSNVSHCGYSPT